MDSSHNEERRQTRSSLINEFDFYFQFIRSLVLDLPEEDDKSIAAAWVHKLRPETFDGEDTENIRLRLDYLKLLLFVLQRRHLVGIFRRTPPDGPLEPFPHNFNISDMGSLLLEQDERQALGGGDAWGTPYAIEISNDLKEFVAAQEIPNFGVQVYYAMSTDDPIHKWALFDERRLPKFIREKIEQLKIMKSAGNMDLLKSKQSLLTEQSQSLKDLEEIANLNKCTSKVKSPMEIENSQERVYQAYINYDQSRPPNFNDNCNGGSDKSWRKSRTSKKVCPDGSKVEVTKVEQCGQSMEPDMAIRAPVRVARSSTTHHVEVQGDDEQSVEAAAQKELSDLMKGHPQSSNVKDSGPCDCPGHPQANQRSPSRRCGSERSSRQRTDNNYSAPAPERKGCSSGYSADAPHPTPSMQVKARSPCRSPCSQPMTFDQEIYIPSPGPQRQRTPCGHMKKHNANCGASRCCPCPKKCIPQDSPPAHCNCRNRDRNAAPRQPEPEKYAQRSPCRPRTCGSGNMRYEQQSDVGSRHRDFNAQGQNYERSDCSQVGRVSDDREQERKARLRRIAELDSRQRTQRCPSEQRESRCPPEPKDQRCPPEMRDQRGPPEPRERCPPEPRERRYTPEPRESRCAPEPRDQRYATESRDSRCPPEMRDQRGPPEPRERCPPEPREQRYTQESRDKRCTPEPREQRCPPESRDQRSPPEFRGGANFSSKASRASDPCPCPCPREGEPVTGSRYQGREPREPMEDASFPCIGGATGRTQRRSNMMTKDPCYDEGSRNGRNISPSPIARQTERPPERQAETRPAKPTGYKEMEVKAICNKTTRYNCPDKNQKTPVVNKTCIVEKSEKIIKPCPSGDALRNGSSASPTGGNYNQEELDDDNILNHCQDDIELPSLTFESSIPCPPDDRRKYFDDPYSRRPSSPMRYTSTPKRYGDCRTPNFGGDVSRIHRPDADFRELTMKSPQDPDISGATCVSSGDSDSDTPEFCDELSSVSPDSPSPGRRIENKGIRSYMREGLTEDISGITEDEYVDAPQLSPDDTFSSPDIPQTPRKGCPPCPPCPPCPGSTQERTRGGYQPPSPPTRPPSRPPSRSCYETPSRKLRNRVDSNAPLPLPRRPDCSPVSRQMIDDSQTSDSDGYDYNAQRNLISALEKADRTTRNRPLPSRTESESVWERGRDEMSRPCGCDEDTSDVDGPYTRRSRYD